MYSYILHICVAVLNGTSLWIMSIFVLVYKMHVYFVYSLYPDCIMIWIFIVMIYLVSALILE